MPYIWDEQYRLFKREDGRTIAYSDGEKVEYKLESIIRNASDRSVSSTELARQIEDWPTEYHLSRLRHCLLRPLSIRPGDRVLEIGCGTGALTRFLGELGAVTTAVEGSPLRARIAAARCQDLPNVQVYVDNLMDFDPAQYFDWVIMVGVLEYAPVFAGGNRPLDTYLRCATRYLASSGKLVIATENKLGLKYWNGCFEDHVNERYVGVEGLYAAGQPATLGKREIGDLIRAAGLSEVSFYYPFPDYKLPSVILTEEGLGSSDFDVADLLARAHARDYTGLRFRNFDDALVLDQLAKNGLLGELSNSYLVVAGYEPSGAQQESRLAFAFSSERVPEFATITTFYRAEGEIRVSKEGMWPSFPRTRTSDSGLVLTNIAVETSYVQGRQLLWSLLRARALPATRQPAQADLFRPWFEYLLGLASLASMDAGPEQSTRLSDLLLSPEFIDCTPFNLIQNGGSLYLIDKEWTADRPVPLGWIVTRGVLYCLSSGVPSGSSEQTLRYVVEELCRSARLLVSAEEIQRWLQEEADFQALVTGKDCQPVSLELSSGGLRRIQDEVGSLSEAIGSYESERQQTRSQVEHAQLQLSELVAAGQQLQARLQQSMLQHQQALARLTEALGEISVLTADREALEGRNAALLAALGEAEQGQAELDRRASEYATHLDRARAEAAVVAAQTKRLEAEHQQLGQQLEQLQHKHAHVLDELETNRSLLQQIQISHGWKALSQYYRLREKVFPEGLRRRLKEAINLGRDMSLVTASGLFDSEWYLSSNPDVVKAAVNPLKHYLRHGGFEGRDPHPVFDSDWYLVQNPDVAKAGVNPLCHYLRNGASEGRDPNPLFDSDWYLAQNPDVAKAGLNPLRHYVRRGSAEGRDPSPLFDCKQYGLQNPAVTAAGAGLLAHRLRSMSVAAPESSDLSDPSANSESTGAADARVDHPSLPNELERWIAGSFSPVAATDVDDSERQYEALSASVASLQRAEIEQFTPLPPDLVSVDNVEQFVSAGLLRVPAVSQVEVSIVVPIFNQLKYALECFASVVRNTTGTAYEIVAVDDASGDSTGESLSGVENLVYLRNHANLGFIGSCNRGAQEARGRYLVFLNSDAQVTPGWLAPLLETFRKFADVGAVGPMVLYPDGRLQEAGALVNPDSTSTLIGLFENPKLPQHNRVREVMYCSGVCLVVERATFLQLGGFDKDFSPAYCEDCDLSFRIRREGLRVMYNPQSVVVHHLSVSSQHAVKIANIITNQQKLSEKWQSQIDQLNEVKLIAWYLPQYHPIPENDRWWGKGFTEWANVTRAQPNFIGHYQPHLPSDLGFYDLRLDEVRKQQGELAKRYGIHGFCYYYYWFAGKRLLDQPLERMLVTNTPDLPFCIAWANENWTRRWDGQDNEILIAQRHSDEDDRAVMRDMARYLKHPRYIRVNGRPLLILYRANLFPDIKRTAATWREVCREEGVGEICLTLTESFDFARSCPDPSSLGFDASVEFPPHGMGTSVAPPGRIINPGFSGTSNDYNQLVVDYLQLPQPGHLRFRSVMPGWDNTPRRQNDPVIFVNTSPGAYQAWLESIIQITHQQSFGDERLVFINAWNEWAEGNHLEPDRRYGHAYLEATLNAKERALFRRDCAF